MLPTPQATPPRWIVRNEHKASQFLTARHLKQKSHYEVVIHVSTVHIWAVKRTHVRLLVLNGCQAARLAIRLDACKLHRAITRTRHQRRHTQARRLLAGADGADAHSGHLQGNKESRNDTMRAKTRPRFTSSACLCLMPEPKAILPIMTELSDHGMICNEHPVYCQATVYSNAPTCLHLADGVKRVHGLLPKERHKVIWVIELPHTGCGIGEQNIGRGRV
jgi:hypothetical protein